jgi:hypothetical protein
MVSMGRLYVGSCASVEPLGLCVRRAGSDLNPNLFLVSMVLAPHGKYRDHVADLPISPGCSSVCFCGLSCRWCAKGRLEVRERKLEMGWHVPVGALKFSPEDHVAISSVQQTLVNMDSFTTNTRVRWGET